MAKSFNLCQHCGKDFQNYKLYWDHLQTHKIRTIPCDSCMKLFASAKTLSDHKNTVHSNRLVCNCCTKTFGTKFSLKFEKFWLKYVVVYLESDIHGERLLECVIDFNSSNI